MTSKEIMAIGLLIFGSLVVAFSAWVEPSGELHSSILTFWGETLTVILLLVGISRGPQRNDSCDGERRKNEASKSQGDLM